MWWINWISDLVFPPRTRTRLVREATLAQVLELLSPVSYPNGVALLPFRTPLVLALITEAKFAGNKYAQYLLGLSVSDFLSEWLDEVNGLEERPVALVPIPLSKKRYRERGYNQVREIARHISKETGVELMPHLLTRTRNTLPQTTLGKDQRAKNLSGAFSSLPVNPAYLYIVMDDVRTTGATLDDAMRSLREAGAVRVLSLAVAY